MREHIPRWRKITAEQYRIGGEAAGDYDEVYIVCPDTGMRREVWDVGIDRDDDGHVVIYTAKSDPYRVPREYPLFVR